MPTALRRPLPESRSASSPLGRSELRVLRRIAGSLSCSLPLLRATFPAPSPPAAVCQAPAPISIRRQHRRKCRLPPRSLCSRRTTRCTSRSPASPSRSSSRAFTTGTTPLGRIVALTCTPLQDTPSLGISFKYVVSRPLAALTVSQVVKNSGRQFEWFTQLRQELNAKGDFRRISISLPGTTALQDRSRAHTDDISDLLRSPQAYA